MAWSEETKVPSAYTSNVVTRSSFSHSVFIFAPFARYRYHYPINNAYYKNRNIRPRIFFPSSIWKRFSYKFYHKSVYNKLFIWMFTIIWIQYFFYYEINSFLYFYILFYQAMSLFLFPCLKGERLFEETHRLNLMSRSAGYWCGKNRGWVSVIGFMDELRGTDHVPRCGPFIVYQLGASNFLLILLLSFFNLSFIGFIRIIPK